MKVVIVMPALNEAATIGAVVRGVRRHGTALVVDDASSDGTARIAKSEGAHVLRLAANAGYEGALDAGFAEAARLGGDVVVTFDSDGQFAPEDIERMLAPVRERGIQLVIGNRNAKARIGEILFGLYTRMYHGVNDILCGVKVYRMELYRAHGRFDGGRAVGTELALSAIRSGARYENVDLEVRPRETGRPRFGSGLKANIRLLAAMRQCIADDVRALWQ